jgi:hypothetical protein
LPVADVCHSDLLTSYHSGRGNLRSFCDVLSDFVWARLAIDATSRAVVGVPDGLAKRDERTFAASDAAVALILVLLDHQPLCISLRFFTKPTPTGQRFLL